MVGELRAAVAEAGDAPPDEIARRNVARVAAGLVRDSRALARLVRAGKAAVVGAMYDVATGAVEFLPPEGGAPTPDLST